MRSSTLEKLNSQRGELLEACNSKALHLVAKEFCISLKTLKEWLSLQRVRPERLLDEDWCREVAVYYEKHSQADTLRHFHIDVSKFRKALTQLGLSPRTPEEARYLSRQQNLKLHGVEYATQRAEVKEKIAITNQSRYGSSRPLGNPAIRQKATQTTAQRYGSPTYNNSNKREATCLLRYGTRSASGSAEIREKIQQTSLNHFGVTNPSCSDEVKRRIAQTKQSKYGGYGWDAPSIRTKCISTCQDRYGVDWYCQTEACRAASKNDSGPNRAFESLLLESGIPYEREFSLSSYSYDFRVDKILIEVDPWITHNTDLHPYSNPVVKTYHLDKSRAAEAAGFRCIHVWEWDDPCRVIELLKSRASIFGRCCSVELVPVEQEREFLSKHHFQGYVRSEIALGLYHEGVLVSLMTFGKPRYSKKCQWELLRYCSTSKVLGGASKLFAAFLSQQDPDSVISYCDRSKFAGEMYPRLGFKYLRSSIGCHWYNPKTKIHLTDNLVRARGVDQLLKTSFGKGTSNEQLLLDAGFVRIYDCGQATYLWTRP